MTSISISEVDRQALRQGEGRQDRQGVCLRQADAS